MNFSLITNYPWWFILFCLIAGGVYSSLLYFKNKESGISNKLNIMLAVFRFAVVSVISFLLLDPFFKTVFRQVEKPIIVLAQDNSESILFNKDSSFYKTDYKDGINKLVEKLSEKHQVKTYSFGDNVAPGLNFDYNEKQTDMSAVFDEIENRFSNRNLAAIILASDGLFNKGMNPVYSGNKIPVYCIALGDTVIKKDIILSEVIHNQFAYLGNSFPLEITASARQLKGKTTRLTVSKGESVLFNKIITFNSDNFSEKVNVLIEAKEVGMQRYRVSLSSLPVESTANNNSRDIFIEVLDNRQKILLLTDAPHPDIAALRQTIETSQNYEVESFTINEFNQNFNKYSLVILHGLPSSKNSFSKVLSDIISSEIPLWLITTNGTSFNQLNSLQVGINISSATGKANEVVPVLSADFPLFTISDQLKGFLKDVPAFECPFGTYKTNTASDVLFYQQIGMVKTENPLMFFTHKGDKKVGVTIGEGLWRWRLRDYAFHNNHDIFNELVSKTIQFLSVKADKSQFRISGKKIFLENESIEMEAEVYNESFELINEPEVTINITNSENKRFPFSFSKTSNAYHLNAGTMPVGDYSYEARVKIGEKVFSRKGKFSISPLVIESINTVADHRLLQQLALKNKGTLVYPDQMNKLYDLLNNREDIQSVSYNEKIINDLINLKWLFFLILFLLSFEWILRKRNGTY